MTDGTETREDRQGQVRIVYDDIAMRRSAQMDKLDRIIATLQSFDAATKLPDGTVSRAKKVGWFRAIFGV